MADIAAEVHKAPRWLWIAAGGGAIFILAQMRGVKTSSSPGGLVGSGVGATSGTPIVTPIVNGFTLEQLTQKISDAVGAQSATDAAALTASQAADKLALDTQAAGAKSYLDQLTGGYNKALADQAAAAKDALDKTNIANAAANQSLSQQIQAAIQAGRDAVAAAQAQNAGALAAAQAAAAAAQAEFARQLAAAQAAAAAAAAKVATPPPAPASGPTNTPGDPGSWTAADMVAYVTNGFRFHGGEILPSWAFTKITTRAGTTVWLPSMFDPALSAGDIFTNSGRGESAIGRIQRYLSDIEAGGTAVVAGQEGTALSAHNVYVVMRQVIQDAARMGYGGQRTGFVHADRFLAANA